MSFILLLTLSVSNTGLAGSSAKCGRGPIRDFKDFGTTYTDIHCVFHDVCWHQNGLLFNLTDSRNVGPWPILVSGSSVPDHDGMILDITPVRAQTLDMILATSNVVFTENAVLLRSFLPDNLFHVVHDDILPVYAMEESLLWLNLTLFFTNNDIQPRFDEYYALLRLPSVYAEPSEIRCFRRLFVGLPKTTLWYQYGFRSPQGILRGTDVPIIERFVQETALKEKRIKGKRKCTILIRRSNRRILNLPEFERFLGEEHQCSVEVRSLESSFSELREVLSITDLLIAMHGAELSLCFLLPAHAVVIELFPYAIDSANYTPYKRLCELLGLIYEPWENKFEMNSVAFPEKWLSTLPPDERLGILNSRIVEPHLCCRNPAWLYRIYQDTRIDKDSFRRILRKAVNRRNSRLRCTQVNYAELVKSLSHATKGEQDERTSTSDWESFWKFLLRQDSKQEPPFYSGRVRDVRCIRSSKGVRVLTWRAPINHGDGVEIENSHFEIISKCGSEVLMTRTRKISFTSASCNESIDVWVQAHGGIKATYPVTC